MDAECFKIGRAKSRWKKIKSFLDFFPFFFLSRQIAIFKSQLLKLIIIININIHFFFLNKISNS